MKAVYYCDPRSMNDATNYYVNIIKSFLGKLGYHFEIAHEIKELKNADVIVTVTERYFLRSFMRYPFKKSVYWAQGAGAEELKMGRGRKTISYYGRLLGEYLAFRNSSMIYVVSEKMIEYVRKKYNYTKKNYVIMPCYNLPLSDTFNSNQYKRPTFVYAGNASVWQSVDIMLDVYCEIEKRLPDANLKLFTKDRDLFLNKCLSRGIKNYSIEYVPVDQIQNELHKYKYGFIMREDNIVNNVATPTKMNSYLASYIIPIFSEAVYDFRENIKLGPYTLCANNPLDVNHIAEMVCRFERSTVNFNDYKIYVDNVFANHYTDTHYIDKSLELNSEMSLL